MGLKEEPFVVVQSFSIEDPYNIFNPEPNLIILDPNDPTEVLCIDVCINQPDKTQVSIDSMTQIAVRAGSFIVDFEVLYEIVANDTVIARINDEMSYQSAIDIGRHTNFPNFSVVDKNPRAGNNTYKLICTNLAGDPSSILAASRSLKATVIPL
ncbi:hypothetical protein [Chengkuizengella axinellae]|uniref:Uncharacterized protein n=1 Tax=Chengkuizengella axinellae TaxID=3064388 RepID=A0ABT9IY11_9BACL|nr:hypothetical protein [Chengkuizengella sp. 2205SS18-9]MDP5274007.1 hypothetical protein [Chengkuizengella sp. 2205SS18-9]